MTSQQWHKDKVVIYIVIGVLAAAGIALYVYMQLAAMSARQPVPVQTESLGGPAVLSPAQSAAKTAAIETVVIQKPATLSKRQSIAKAAAIQAFEMQGK